MYKYVMFVLLGIALSACAEVSVGEAKTTIHIVDTEGQSVPDATVYASFSWSYEYEDTERFSDLTDTNGLVVFSGKLGPELDISIYKDGWYKSTEVLNWKKYFSDSKLIDGKWQPWNPTIEIVLKEKKNPIPLYCRQVIRTNIPVFGEKIGYDLFEGDWVSPYGTGHVSDFIVSATNDYRGIKDYDVDYSITFSQSEDGLIRFDKPKYGSRLVSNQSAPEDGYLNEWAWEYGRKGDEGLYNTSDSTDVNYYFRIRTKVDESGKIISAYYGKIYRGIEVRINRDGSLNLSFNYYLNTTSLDRNVEYDMKTNLAKEAAPPGERGNSVYSVNQP